MPECIGTEEEGETASGHSLECEPNKSSSSQDDNSVKEPAQPTGSSTTSRDIKSGDFGMAVELKKTQSLTI